MKNSDNYIFYNIVSHIFSHLGHIVFWDKVIDNNNILVDKPCILAGNHTSIFDSYLLFRSTKRPIHFIAKKELFKGPFAWVFKNMHLIPVDREHKNDEARDYTLMLLKENKIIAIFPEGTFHDKGSKKKKELLLPFKPGAVSFALKSGAPIIPFAIIGKFKLFSRPKIVFGKPIYIDKMDDNNIKYLENTVRELIIKNKTY